MPQRFLRPGLRTSERWNSVSREAQVTYIGLLTLVDDFGQYDARPAIILADCFAIWNDLNPAACVDSAGIRRILRELAAKNLIELHDSKDGGKNYLQVTQWQERVREGAKPKWSVDVNPQQSAAERSGTQQSAAKSAPPLAISHSPLAISLRHLPSPSPEALMHKGKCAKAATENEMMRRIEIWQYSAYDKRGCPGHQHTQNPQLLVRGEDSA